MSRLEALVEEHRTAKDDSLAPVTRLKQLVPTVNRFHTNLPLEEAWNRYDLKYCVSQRSHIPPSFNEVRHTLNLAQVMAIAEKLQMICFDGDGTLYSDGDNFSNVPLAATICLLMENDVKVVLITAAGYGWDGKAYETRVRGLLDLFISNGLSEEVMGRFFVLGGEVNIGR
jgi:IMP and pyridine-specific 5'-nucleotidase